MVWRHALRSASNGARVRLRSSPTPNVHRGERRYHVKKGGDHLCWLQTNSKMCTYGCKDLQASVSENLHYRSRYPTPVPRGPPENFVCILTALGLSKNWNVQIHWWIHNKLELWDMVNWKYVCSPFKNTKPDGVRSVGRLKLHWEDGVDQGIRILRVKNWERVALHRDEWAKLLKKARAHQGLSS